MKTPKFTYWKDGDYYLGSLNDYPDYETQGTSKDELVAGVRDRRFQVGQVRQAIAVDGR